MTVIRKPAKNSKYYVEKEVFDTVLHFCRQYPLWVAELKADSTSVAGLNYDKDAIQTSNDSDPTSKLGMRRAMISRKKDLVDNCARQVAADLSDWLIKGVGYGLTYYQLYERGIPCSRNTYYSIRRRFYYEMSKLI